MEKVSLLRVESCDPVLLRDALEKSIKASGFDMSLIKNRVVAVKPNLLTSAVPEKGLTTHPVFFHQVIRIIKDRGGIPVLVESPAFIPLAKVLQKNGYTEIIEKEKIRVGDTKKTLSLSNPGSKSFRYFDIAEDFVKADFVFNLPKMKTHGLIYFTGAVKNYFGLIHGLEKSKYHFRADNPVDFASFIIDLYSSLVNSKGRCAFLNIMDGITGLEGEGPGASGKPVNSCAVIAGMDAVAVDSVAVKTAGLDLRKALTCVYGGSRGAGVSDLSKINISGNNFSDFTVKFKPPAARSGVSGWPFSSPMFKNMLIEKPVPMPDKCILCYQCRTICPAEAISKSTDSRIPLYNYSRCIRCYCCMEICPEGAIELRKSLFQKITGY
jgi:uncharacterized protein (DUF362 family)/Pyruvate/2-oxoacid:ferredoxin oxidoreductase delta subunit